MDAWKNTKTLFLRSPTTLMEQIVNFENNPFLTMRSKEQLVYTFPLQECISLQQLIYAFEHKFIQIFRGQVLLIVRMILQHYVEMHSEKLNHGNLSSSNIWIHLGGPLRFSSYARKQEFLKIYFVDYNGDANQESNDQKNLNFVLGELLILSGKDSQNQFMQFSNNFLQCVSIEQLKKIEEEITRFLDNNLDPQKQILRNNFDYKEVGYTSNRYRQETSIKTQIEGILTYEQTNVVEGEQNIFFINLYQYLQQIITDYRMKEIIKDIGKALENNYLGVTAKDIIDCQNRINPISKEFIRIFEKKLLKKELLEKGVQQIQEFSQLFNTEIGKTFKFTIQIPKDPEQIIFDSWVDWIQSNLVDNPKIKKINTQLLLQNSKDAQIKMYDQLFEKEIVHLIEQLL